MQINTNFIAVLSALLLPATVVAQSAALERLDNSRRHHEWVSIEHGGRTVECFLVFPEVADKVPVVVVIHENRGLNDWARSVADQVAEAGYIAIAPDLLTGMGPDGGKTSDFPGSDAARTALYKLSPDQITADLNASANYAAKLPASNGKTAVAGFCWGGKQSFRFATNRQDLTAAYVFYGTPPEAESMSGIQCPVYGFYGGNDARVNATVPETKHAMEKAGRTYEAVTYPGAGHGFMRSGEAADAKPTDKTGRQQAWDRWTMLLKRI